MTEGKLRPYKDDILYIVEQKEDKIWFRKFLVLDVKIHKSNIYIDTLNFINIYLEKENLFCQLSKEYDISGVDGYILSML
ncbi:MAG: hypothetical protein HFJ20_06555 [Clostridia bacterium]|nr:hypothetical protein [Clostridia bacterium]